MTGLIEALSLPMTLVPHATEALTPEQESMVQTLAAQVEAAMQKVGSDLERAYYTDPPDVTEVDK